MTRSPRVLMAFVLGLVVPVVSHAQQAACPAGSAGTFAAALADSARLYRGVFTPDGRELWFFKRVGDDPRAENYRIFRAVRTQGSWITAEQVRLGDDASDLYPAFSPDGRRLVFASYRRAAGDTTARPNASLWMSEWIDGAWTTPRAIAELAMPGHYHSQVAWHRDGTLRFRRTTPDWRSTITYATRWDGHSFESPAPEPAIQRWTTGWRTDFRVAGGDLSPDGNAVLLDVVPLQNGRAGTSDLWLSLRNGQEWSDPVRLGPLVNDPAEYDTFPFFSPDGCTVHWTRSFGRWLQAPWREVLADAARH